MKTPGSCVVEIQSKAESSPSQHVLGVGSYVIGSAADCDLRVEAAGVSRRHLSVEVLADGGTLIGDLNSSNGTCIGRRRISRCAVTEPVRLRLGEALLTIHPDTEAADVVPLPVSDADAPRHRQPSVPSLVTEIPGRGAIATDALDACLQRLAAGESSSTALSALLLRWREQFDADALQLARSDLPGAPLAVAGEMARSADAVSEQTDPPQNDGEIAASGLLLQIRWNDPAHRATAGEVAAFRVCLAALASAIGLHAPLPDDDGRDTSKGDVGSHQSAAPAMRDLYALTDRVAASDISVLIRGESGVGKELLARHIHQLSPRRDGPFLAINCAALPTELLEAELFGIERGIATGVDAREGLLERAAGGTLFLDEMGDMAQATQAKILRVLESDSVYRVGGTRAIPLDVRFVAATHQSLEERIEAGEFRLDLFHRIAAVELNLPPLRERRGDIAMLATQFLADELARLNRPSPGISQAALAALCHHRWPGNVRELRNEMARAALLLNAHQPLERNHLSPRIAAEERAPADLSLDAALLRAEQDAFAIAQTAAGSEHGAAMALLKLPRSSYFRRLKQLRGDDDAAMADDATACE